MSRRAISAEEATKRRIDDTFKSWAHRVSFSVVGDDNSNGHVVDIDIHVAGKKSLTFQASAFDEDSYTTYGMVIGDWGLQFTNKLYDVDLEILIEKINIGDFLSKNWDYEITAGFFFNLFEVALNRVIDHDGNENPPAELRGEVRSAIQTEEEFPIDNNEVSDDELLKVERQRILDRLTGAGMSINDLEPMNIDELREQLQYLEEEEANERAQEIAREREMQRQAEEEEQRRADAEKRQREEDARRARAEEARRAREAHLEETRIQDENRMRNELIANQGRAGYFNGLSPNELLRAYNEMKDKQAVGQSSVRSRTSSPVRDRLEPMPVGDVEIANISSRMSRTGAGDRYGRTHSRTHSQEAMPRTHSRDAMSRTGSWRGNQAMDEIPIPLPRKKLIDLSVSDLRKALADNDDFINDNPGINLRNFERPALVGFIKKYYGDDWP